MGELILESNGQLLVWFINDNTQHLLHRSVISGVINGDLDLIRQGIREGGNAHAILDPFLGEIVLKIGRAHVDFPVAPAIHVAMNLARNEHLSICQFLLRMGADLNDFVLPQEYDLINKKSTFINSKGYPPAIFYGIGMGRPPTNAHAALVKRLHESYSHKFNRTKLQEWIQLTRSPPLLHIPILARNFDMTYVMVSEFQELVLDERDSKGLSALHVATWMNDIPTLVLLLYNGAKVTVKDSFGRTALHYAAMRGLNDVVNLLLIDPEEENADENINRCRSPHSLPFKQLKSKDKDGMTPWMLAISPPVINSTATLLRLAMLRCGLQIPISDSMATAHHDSILPEASTATRDSSTLSKSEFRRVYLQRQRPVVINNHLLAGEKVWAFRDQEAFLHRYGDLKVQSSGGFTDSQNGQMNLSMFLNRCFTPQQCNDNFTGGSCPQGVIETPAPSVIKSTIENNLEICDKIVQGNFMQLDSSGNNLIGNDIMTPELFRYCDQKDNEPIRLTIGSAHSSLIPTWQQGNASWSLVFVGKVIWLLAPPGDAEILMNISNTKSYVKEDWMEAKKIVNREELAVEVLRKYIQNGLSVSLVAGVAGDVIFIPHGWVYATIFVTASVLFNQEICTLLHTAYPVRSLGRVLYGGMN